MSVMLQFDEATSRQIEAAYTTRDVVEQRRVLLDLLAPRPGEQVLDIGSGPGFLACELAEVVGPSGHVHGIDPSEAMLSLARSRQPTAQAAPVEFAAGNASALPFPDASFDIVTSTQVYEYVADVAGALVEAHRCCGQADGCSCWTDWDSVVWRSSDPARMRRVLSAWDEHLADPHLPRRLSALLVSTGFSIDHRSTIALFNAGYDENTYSAGVMRFVSGYVPGHAGLTDDDARAWADDLVGLGPDYLFSINRCLFLAVK